MAAANIPIESLVDKPLGDKHYPNRLFEDRSGKTEEFTGAFVIYGLNHEKKTNKLQSVHDYVCDAIWDMGFDAKPDFFSSVARLSNMKNAPLVCELKKIHLKLGNEILESLEDVTRIHPELLTPTKEVVISKFLPPPPQVMMFFNKKLTRASDAKGAVIEACTYLGLEVTEEKIKIAEVVYEKYNCVVCEFADINIAKKFYNFRDVVPLLHNKCPINSVSFYREHKDYYYDNMLLISGLNTKRKDCARLFLDVCEELGVDVTESDISRCDWLYSKAFKSKAQRSPLVVQLNSEEKRVAVFEASADEAKVNNDLRLATKPRKPRLPRRRRSEKGEGELESEEVATEVATEPVVKVEETASEEVKEVAEGVEGAEGVELALVYRKIYINPFISLPHSLLYTATRDLARRHRNLVCLPMSFYGRITIQLKENEEIKKEEMDSEVEENAASAVDDLLEEFKSLSLDGKTMSITSPLDLWNFDKKFRSASLDKYYMYTDPYFVDVGYTLEPYEWFSCTRENDKDKRLSRRQLERSHPF